MMECIQLGDMLHNYDRGGAFQSAGDMLHQCNRQIFKILYYIYL